MHVPSFQTLWGFTLASDSPLDTAFESQVDLLAAERIAKTLKYYDGESHLSMFALPKFLRDGFRQEQRINRDAAPVFMV